MELFLYISKGKYSSFNDIIKYNLLLDKGVEITEFDFLYFEIVSEFEIDVNNTNFILGSTIISIDENYLQRGDKFIYQLNDEEVSRDILINDKINKSPSKFNINGFYVNFSQLFINELGYTKPLIKFKDELTIFNSLYINSPKVNDENFQTIIKYLMFNDYFDSNIIYKNNLYTDLSYFENSLLESIKLLHKKVEEIFLNINSFKTFSIQKKYKSHIVKPYTNNSIVDFKSFSWLMDNVDLINNENGEIKSKRVSNIRLKSKNCYLENILQESSISNFSSDENRIILGYLNLYILLINQIKSKINKNISRTDFKSFSDYLLTKYNDYVIFYLDKLSNYFFQIKLFFNQVLKVKKPLYEFPVSNSKFLTTSHYSNFFEIIKLYNNLFSKQINFQSKLSLEIESFDKLFERYVFFLIKDTLYNSLGLELEYKHSLKELDFSNNLSGKHIINTTDGIKISICYEDLPIDFVQYSALNNEKYYNPDFVIEINKNGYKDFIILDAKYKKYKKHYFKKDIEHLSLKYLHKIGVDNKKNRVVGLYVISINEKLNYNKIFSKEFDILTSDSPVIPNIGGIEVNPIEFDINQNYIQKVFLKHLKIFKQTMHENLN